MSFFTCANYVLAAYVAIALAVTGITVYGFVVQDLYPSFSEYFFQSTLKSWLLILCIIHPWFFAISTFGFAYANTKDEQIRIGWYAAFLFVGFNLFALHPYLNDQSSFTALHYMIATLVLLWSKVHVAISIGVAIALKCTNNNIVDNYLFATHRVKRRRPTRNDKLSVCRSLDQHGTNVGQGSDIEDVLDDCAICLDKLEKSLIKLNQCGHFFHRQCLGVYWLSSYPRFSCPLCRHKFTRV